MLYLLEFNNKTIISSPIQWKVTFLFLNPLLKTPWEGAQTTIYCAVSEEMEGVTGKYLADCRIKKTNNPQATDDQVAEKLWEASAKLTKI